ncbi:Tetratricopeptide repeat protein [Denitrovibrio acetiphilus DSM 12809]|uniref:Tetratricopeptide repeat protein n=1 Tax=Denitrovibrio acetiphilus (strain DSM 12809 / NBRC 114555 / N2460) TaxID=522772 RepID=D4H6K2_DENA2|nr:tetratricopeptide repeat protein [Denitrovibrio acetiphilus]ADD69676.1 Tetratricopeptide repeat protein [Denitrovibrio acetiphilus DSM 12809]
MNIINKFLVSTYERVAFQSYTLSKFAKADKYFRKIIAIEPDRVGTCYNLGMVNLALGNYAEAEKYVGRERARIGDTYEICRAMADIYWHMKNRESAYRFFKLSKETAMSDKDKNLMTKKMGICASDKSFTDALAAAKMFEEADRLMSEKKYDQAEELYLEGLEKDPSNFLAMNNLGVIAMNIRMNYDNAENFFRMGDAICHLKMIEENLVRLMKLRSKTGR